MARSDLRLQGLAKPLDAVLDRPGRELHRLGKAVGVGLEAEEFLGAEGPPAPGLGKQPVEPDPGALDVAQRGGPGRGRPGRRRREERAPNRGGRADIEVDEWPTPKASYSLSARLGNADTPPQLRIVVIRSLRPVRILCG